MADQGGLDRSSESVLLIAFGYIDNGRILLADPISKRLVSYEHTLAEQIWLIEQILGNINEQQVARGLNRGDA